MTGFFQPPSSHAERSHYVAAPRWTGRPQGPPLGVAVSDVLIAKSDQAAVHVAYVDAFPDGFELRVHAQTSIPWQDLTRTGDHGPDPFGSHWPMVGEDRTTIPEQILRVGMQFADGHAVTNVGGHDQPIQGPTLTMLSGGSLGKALVRPAARAAPSLTLLDGGGSGGLTCEFHQGYWISPLPPSGPLRIICEWPVAGIPETWLELDGQLILDGAQRSRAMFPDGPTVSKDGRQWELGTAADIAWINQGTTASRAITAAIPPVFAGYGTLELPDQASDQELADHERAVIALLSRETEQQPWWLGYLDTGASDVVFPYTPRIKAYYEWGYVLVKAGPEQAAAWRTSGFNWALPDLMFPSDRSWLLSTMWDDDWTSIGGSNELIAAFVEDPLLGPRARRVSVDQDAIPPGHEAN